MAIKTDICVIGAGSGGLSAAVGAVQMGASVVLVEQDKMGGDCLNTGCVPSKALLAAAKKSYAAETSRKFGVHVSEVEVDKKNVHSYVSSVIKTIEPHDSVERMKSLGILVLKGKGIFKSPYILKVGDKEVHAKWFIIATGSHAAIPPIPGLENIPYLTNETIFKVKEPIEELIVIGGGPIGVEMAQAHARLHSNVTLVSLSPLLPNDDAEAVEVVREQLAKEKIHVYERTAIHKVEKKGEKIHLVLDKNGRKIKVQGSHLLLAAGRAPNVHDMGLEDAGIIYSNKGIEVNKRLRTNKGHIFAIGDVIGGAGFTHVAGYHAGIVLRNILFRLPARVKETAIPWVTYTDPELAHVGIGEKEAKKRNKKIKILKWNFKDNDRAQAEGRPEGFIKVMLSPKGVILGTTIVGMNAGELIAPWVMAVEKGHKIGTFTSAIIPYPTLSEISKRLAGSFFTPTLFGKRVKRLVKFLMRFKRIKA